MYKPLKIVVDHNIPGVDRTFACHGDVVAIDGRAMDRDQLRMAQALIVRSVTAVNEDLLEGTDVRFVGTTTIGTDHMDIRWLEQRGIRWASAPGCNADAAAQYTLAMMLLAGKRLGFNLGSCSVGIVGHGNVGSRLHNLLDAYGVKIIEVCDPPLADAGKHGMISMAEIANCDVVTFHVPLTRSGPYPTIGLVGEPFLSCLHAGALLVNTSRGKVTQSEALQNWLASGLGHAALDVWPDEPDIDAGLLGLTTVATPHVAGYSLDGKMRGTEMVYLKFCNWLKTNPVSRNLVSALAPQFRADNRGLTTERAVLTACPVERDDAQMRKLAQLSPDRRPAFFDELRRTYPQRRDFSGWRLSSDAPEEIAMTLRKLGFC